MNNAEVGEYYAAHVRDEWQRLVRNPYQRIELATTLHFLDLHLPPHGQVLDAGGGPGRYTLELAARGYDVVLLDLAPANLAFARRQIKRAGLAARVAQVVEGTIVDLSRFAAGTFDAVLCLGGPLSHLLDAQDRAQALAELVRVAAPGAPLFVSVMGRLSLLALELIRAQHEIALPHFTAIRDTGTYMGGAGFTPCHFFLPEEFEAAFAGLPARIEATVGLEGISARHRQAANRLARDPVRWATWLATHFQTCTHPAVFGMSEHLLIVCRKL